MSTLILKLAGPLQSWGVQGRLARRSTEIAPTKSGVVGLLAAAQGRFRDADVSDLAALSFGVRIDQPGSLLRDFQTEYDQRKRTSHMLTHRYYLRDAVFLAVIEGDKAVIELLADAVRKPAFPLYLGRRSCPPATRLVLDTSDLDLVSALRTTPWQASAWYQDTQPPGIQLAYSHDARPGDEIHEQLADYPVSFSPAHRKYTSRGITHGWVPARPQDDDARRTSDAHDPFALMEGA